MASILGLLKSLKIRALMLLFSFPILQLQSHNPDSARKYEHVPCLWQNPDGSGIGSLPIDNVHPPPSHPPNSSHGVWELTAFYSHQFCGRPNAAKYRPSRPTGANAVGLPRNYLLTVSCNFAGHFADFVFPFKCRPNTAKYRPTGPVLGLL